jgi:mannose-6-phosphate isomerase
VAIALDALTALVGFRSFDEIVSVLERYPELSGIVAPALPRRMMAARAVPEQRALFGEFFAALIDAAEARPAELGAWIDRLAGRLLAAGATLDEREQLFFQLQAKYGSQDVGLVLLYLLNLVHLEAGQGLYTPAGVPHAYVQGNIVECMANSDNVIRAGLTPKFKDACALLEVVDYELGPVPILDGASGSGRMTYLTPAAEFQLSRWELERGTVQTVRTEGRPQVLLVIRGTVSIGWGPGRGREALLQGESVLIPALLPSVELEALDDTLLFDVEVPA